MGKLVKNHLARLIVLTAAVYQVAAGVHGYFWPKIFWDFITHALDSIVTPIPILQTLNVVFGLLIIGWEYPLPWLIPGTALHRSIIARLVVIPMAAVVAVMLYQGTNAALYYLIGMAIYAWGYNEGEIVCMPWKVPSRGKGGASRA